jgi:hypothetical protein
MKKILFCLLCPQVGYAFLNYSELKTITVPNGDTSIESNTFSGCTNLSSIVFSNSNDIKNIEINL